MWWETLQCTVATKHILSLLTAAGVSGGKDKCQIRLTGIKREYWMGTEMASDGPSPHSPSLRLGLPAPQPSRRHHAQSLLGPLFHDPRTHHVLESHPEQASLPPRRWVTTHCRLSLRPCTAPLSCSLQPLLKLPLSSLRPCLLQFV